MKLLHVIAFTSDIERMKEFYRDGLGLKVASESPHWVSFRSGPGDGGLALLAVGPEQRLEFELCFESEDVRTDYAELGGRGIEFTDAVAAQPFGDVVHMRDPEGNLISLLQPSGDSGGAETRAQDASFGEPQWGDAEGSVRGADVAVALEATARVVTVAVNVRDLATARAFYHDLLGLEVGAESTSEVRFETGAVDVSLHSKISPPARERQLGQPVTIGVSVQDLLEWSETARERGVHFTTMPADLGYGWFAEALDPDGNRVTFREPDEAEELEDRGPMLFEDDDAPRRTAIRKSVKKISKAVSRLVVKPRYKVEEKKVAAREKAEVHLQAVAEAKAAGTEVAATAAARANQRSTPATEKVRPAIGRLKKAQRKTLVAKKHAVASASREKAAKQAAARTTRKPARPAPSSPRKVTKAAAASATRKSAKPVAKAVAKRGAKRGAKPAAKPAAKSTARKPARKGVKKKR